MKIIAIAGSGRTGTTLVSLLLSQNRDVFNLGQMRDFWGSFISNEICTCCQPLQACPVWSKAMAHLFGTIRGPKVRQMHDGMMAFIADATLIPNWSDKPSMSHLAAKHSEFLHNLGTFLQKVADIVGTSNFVDTSKTPEVALAYHMIDGVETRVLNLVRDPRAVASSWEKKHDVHIALRQSRSWLQRQVRLARCAPMLGSRFALLKYEDFTRKAKASIEQVLCWAGVDATVDHFDSESHAAVSWERQHLFAPANEAVLAEKRSAFDIVEASAWRKDGNAQLHQSVVEIAGPMMTRLGYDIEQDTYGYPK